MNILLRQPCSRCSRYYTRISKGGQIESVVARSLQLLNRDTGRRASFEAFATRQDNKPSSIKSGGSKVLPKHLYKPTSNKIDTSLCKLSEYQINKMIRDRGYCRARRMYKKADEILQKLNANNVFIDDKVKQWGIGINWRSGTRVKYTTQVKDCQSIKEAVELTQSCLKSGLTTRNLSSFWSVVPQLLQQHNASNANDDDFELPNQLESLLAQTLEDVDTFSYRDLAQTVLGFAKIIKYVGSSDNTIFPEDSPHQLLHNLLIGEDSKSKQFIFRNIACASLHILPEFDPRHMSNFIYAYAIADYVPDFDDGSTLFDILAVEVIPNLMNYNSQDVANTLWSYANVKENNSTLFQEAGNIISKSNLDEYKPQELSNILWGYATANEPHPLLFNRVGNYISSLENLNEYKPQELTGLVWSYSTAKEQHPLLFEKIADHIVASNNMKQYTPQAISNICWAYGASGDSHSNLFKSIADYIVSHDNLDEFGPHALSNIVRANAIQMKQMYIFADEWHPTLFQKIADYIIGLDNLDSYVGQDVSNILWSYATAKEKNSTLFRKMAEHIISLDNLDDYSAQSLKDIVWACANSNESHPSLFEKIAGAAFSRQNEFTSQGIVNFLWAFATNGQLDRILFLSFVPTLKAMLTGFNRQELANVAWIYAVANVSAPSLFHDDFIAAILKKEEDEFTLEALVQLHQWQLWQIEIKSGIRLPDSLREKCYEAFLLRVPEPSRFQNDVATSLTSIGLHAEEEVLTKSGYRIDMVVEVYGEKVAIEVDGPSHFIGREANGSTILKRRQISNLESIQVVSIPFFHWNKLKDDGCKKQQYLRTNLSLNCYKAP